MQNSVYDYIIVGSGPAGATMARLLSDDRRNSVLLLEAGENNDGDEPIRNSTFAVALGELFIPQYLWPGETSPQANVNNRVFRWTGGRLLGGGSSVNGEQYVRPTRDIFEQWSNYVGPLWSPAAATKRFVQLEKYNGTTDNPAARGFKGRLDVRQTPRNPTAMVKKLVTAIELATGYPEILDYNNPDTPIGPFTRWQLTQKPDGTRESSSTAFLSPDSATGKEHGANARRLKVLTQSTALRIIFSRKRAIGVEYLNEGKHLSAYAHKKIIISAGSHSAKLLMLSGIGPANDLRQAGIPVIFDNPNVGKNLNNHLLPVSIFSTNPSDLPLPPDDPNALYVGGAFLPDPSPGADPSVREIQIVPFVQGGVLLLGFAALRPRSRGTVRIQSDDPLKLVLTDYNYLSDPADMEQIKNTFRIYIRNIAARLAMIDPAYQLLSPTQEILDNDAALENYIRQTTIESFHEMGTLRMAPTAADGVVNYKGDVFGVRDLVVADNSVIPFTADGNTQAPSYLIGWTIAQQLLEERDK